MKLKQDITLYNTKTKRKQSLRPIDGNTVSIYSCGPTVYRQAHVGNLRAYIFADTLNRTLRHFGYAPKHIINLTDVGHLTDDADAGEDKVEEEAKKKNESAADITQRYTDLFLRDLKKLNVKTAHYRFPKATEHIQEQIRFIRRIEEKGHTYKIDDGIYFSTETYPDYGALGLSGISDENEHARIQKTAGKKHPRDFALWKLTPSGTTRQQEWDSPWGRGFPGWHIECSAMANALLGETIDIHTGGADHIAIHHNNEIAQSESVTNQPLANIWMHGAFLTDNGKKMSKSLSNTNTLDDVEKKGYTPLALRYLFLQASYRTPLSFSFTALTAAQTALVRLNEEYAALPKPIIPFLGTKPDKVYTKMVDTAIADDLNTAKVLAITRDILRDKTLPPKVKHATLHRADEVLGILTPPRKKKEEAVPGEVTDLLRQRDSARADGNYTTADEIRDRINKLGYEVTDTGDKSTAAPRNNAV